MTDVLRKDQLEKSLFEEKRRINNGQLQEDNPQDHSLPFRRLCEASRRGDLKVCQEAIQEGVNINASDEYNYTPLILASLCGHYEVVHLLLESGALCERDTFQGERCLYNALNDRIRDLLLSYDYSKSTDPLQPFAAHISSLLIRDAPPSSDFTIQTQVQTFATHRFILAARSPYFRRSFQENPDLLSWNLPDKIPNQSLSLILRYIYLGDIPRDLSSGDQVGHTDEEILAGIDRLALLFEIQNLMQRIIEGGDRRMQRQQRQAEVERGRTQIETWFRGNVLANKFEVEASRVKDVKWSKNNAIFADVLLCADDEPPDDLTPPQSGRATPAGKEPSSYIPIGPMSTPLTSSPAPPVIRAKSTIFPVHKAMLLRAEFFLNMFSSNFLEAQSSDYLRVIPVACSPAVLESILIFFYSERADFGLQLAVEVLFAADMLLIERLKARAAVVISSLGNGAMTTEHPAATPHTDPFLPDGNNEPSDSMHGQSEEDPLDPYATLRAAWDLRVPRLETFAARYFAYRLEKYIDEEEFLEITRESAARIQARQETDSIELIDDIRHYLSERFRLRFEGDGIEELLNEDSENSEAARAARLADMQDAGDGGDWESLAATEAMEQLSLKEKARAEQAERARDQDADDVSALLAKNQTIVTLDGEVAGDEFAADALNYQILLGKIDTLLDRLQLDA